MELPTSKEPNKKDKEVHQSDLRACHMMVRVKLWLKAGVPGNIILQLIYEMECADVKIKRLSRTMIARFSVVEEEQK